MRFNKIEVGKRIRKLRNSRKISQFELGQQVNVSRNYIGKLEKDERVAAVEIYIDLAEYFGVGLDELLLRKTEDEIKSKSRDFLKTKLCAVIDLPTIIVRSL